MLQLLSLGINLGQDFLSYFRQISICGITGSKHMFQKFPVKYVQFVFLPAMELPVSLFSQ